MMNVSMLNIFNDANGRVIYKPVDVFEKYAKNDKPDYLRFTR